MRDNLTGTVQYSQSVLTAHIFWPSILCKEKNRCEYKDSELVAIQSYEENKFIQGLLRGDDATGAWIGVVLVDDEGGQWINHNTYDEQKFTYWADIRTGSPKGLTGNDEFDIVQCAYLSKQDRWEWAGKDCYSGSGMKSVCKSW
ncbi:hypothetical protein PoB_004226000 [Plakobranchus ocellatus]|uniref:C-type lectin domain-containing protein n=1 Tax=Plakobranchus ocellatus TaxID=259542 RepID=A0AAV4B8A0_9GAST|nr:hypothetical protein PoB_004226000 [Plakobranchus ocellatus]